MGDPSQMEFQLHLLKAELDAANAEIRNLREECARAAHRPAEPMHYEGVEVEVDGNPLPQLQFSDFESELADAKRKLARAIDKNDVEMGDIDLKRGLLVAMADFGAKLENVSLLTGNGGVQSLLLTAPTAQQVLDRTQLCKLLDELTYAYLMVTRGTFIFIMNGHLQANLACKLRNVGMKVLYQLGVDTCELVERILLHKWQSDVVLHCLVTELDKMVRQVAAFLWVTVQKASNCEDISEVALGALHDVARHMRNTVVGVSTTGAGASTLLVNAVKSVKAMFAALGTHTSASTHHAARVRMMVKDALCLACVMHMLGTICEADDAVRSEREQAQNGMREVYWPDAEAATCQTSEGSCIGEEAADADANATAPPTSPTTAAASVAAAVSPGSTTQSASDVAVDTQTTTAQPHDQDPMALGTSFEMCSAPTPTPAPTRTPTPQFAGRTYNGPKRVIVVKRLHKQLGQKNGPYNGVLYVNKGAKAP